MKTVKITLADKRFVKKGENDSLIYSVDGYKGGVFTIPKVAMVGEGEQDKIQTNDFHFYPATTYTIHKWLYDKIKDKLDKMSSAHFTMPNQDN